MRPIVIIPAYNPDEKLVTLVENFKKLDLQIVVVNDGSKQECMNIFETLKNQPDCEICSHPRNMGKGAALKTGIQYSAQNYPECWGYVTADADGQHATEDILKVVNTLEENPEHFILGTRDFSEKNIPFKSRWGNRITSFVFSLSTGKRYADTQTGLRGIPRKLTETCLSVRGNRYEYEMNLLLEIAHSETPLISVPIAVIYLEGNQSSHFQPVRDSARIYLNIFKHGLKYSLTSLASSVIDLLLFTLSVKLIFGTGSAGILAATVIARLASGNANFLINKHWVFQSKNHKGQEAMKYLTLFCGQMMLSWAFVASLSSLPLPITLIKIGVDTSLFFISYQIQKKYIFNTKKKGLHAGDERIFHKAL